MYNIKNNLVFSVKSKAKYIKKITIKQFKRSSYLRQVLMVIDKKETNIKINIIKNEQDYYDYVFCVSDIEPTIGFLITPMNHLVLNHALLETFDIYWLNSNLNIINKIDDLNKNINQSYYYSVLMVKKNIDKIYDIKIGSKINLKKIIQ